MAFNQREHLTIFNKEKQKNEYSFRKPRRKNFFKNF